MALNELIAQGAQFKQPDMIARYGQLQGIQNASQTNALNQMKMDEMSRGVNEMNQVRELYRGGMSMDDPNAIGRIAAISPTQAQALAKWQQEVKEKKLQGDKHVADTAKTNYETGRKKLIDAITDMAPLTTAEQAIKHINQKVASGALSQDHADRILQTLPTNDPSAFAEWRTKTMLGALDAQHQLERQFYSQDSGGVVSQMAVPKYDPTAKPQVIGTTTKVMTPGENATAQTAANRLAFDSDPTRQGAVAAGRTTGTEKAKNLVAAEAALPGIIAGAEQLISQVDTLAGRAPKTNGPTDPGVKPHPGLGQAVGLGVPGLKYIHGSDQASFNARLEQIQGSAFLKAYEALKGGGSITEVEGQKGTTAINRMSTAQSEKEFNAAAKEFIEVVRRGVTIAKQKAAAGAAPAGNGAEVSATGGNVTPQSRAAQDVISIKRELQGRNLKPEQIAILQSELKKAEALAGTGGSNPQFPGFSIVSK
jgi:hypothetical protein